MATDVGTAFGGLFGGALTGVITIVGFLLVAVAIIGTAWYVKYIRQFNIKAEIISTRANIGGIDQYKIIFDKAGLLYDKKDKIYYLRIKDMKVDLPAPPFNVLIPTDTGNMVKIWQKSAEEFVFLLPDTINRDVIVRQDGKAYPSAMLNVKQVEGDISYWNTKRKERDKNLFSPESTLMKLLPIMVPFLMFILVIFMTWMVLKNFEVLKEVAANLKDTATILKGSTQAAITTTTG